MLISTTDSLCQVEGETCCKHRQAPKQKLLINRKQFITPSDCRTQGVVTRLKTSALTGDQQAKTVLQTFGNFLNSQHIDACAGQLQRQGQTIQPPANLSGCAC